MQVVIPAHRAAADIGACIAGLLRAGFAPGDVVVVDDASSDGTAEIAKRAGVAVIRNGANMGAAASRNAGAAAGTSDVIVFVDADVVVAPDTRAVIERVLENPGVAAVFGAYDTAPMVTKTVSRFRNLLHRHTHVSHAGDVTSFWTGLGAVRRADFESVGGFDSSQRMMEDVKFGMALARAGRRIVLCPDLQGTHRKGWSLAGMIRTDLLHRAIPWARLLRSEGAAMPRALATDLGARISVLSVLAMLVSVLAAFWAPLAALAGLGICGAVLIAANWAFLRGLAGIGGLRLTLAAIPLLAVHYFCGGLGYAWVLVTPRR
ncbi:hypothetical protein OCGS_2516 [Oceaniovalibus guishaninsula JLT2003]|uniref:Glycosyltransferase 2-like domain-containing protein n=2 Tax=Oceaniovalibus TaxID=1207070 RepID=K2HK92_9RHOB|nr:hypothetical protein OCGS_2516 [Oceaniovalibus guishaninsula JLT2003]